MFKNLRTLTIKRDINRVINYELILPQMILLSSLTLSETYLYNFLYIYTECKSLRKLKILPFNKSECEISFLEIIMNRLKSRTIQRAFPLTVVVLS